MSRLPTVLALLVAAVSTPALAQKVVLNPSDQTANSVTGGGNESQYALDIGNRAKPILVAAGFTTRVDHDFYNSPSNANSWGAAIFVSLHTNAGGGHGVETLHVGSTQGSLLASRVLSGLLSALPYQSRGTKLRTNLHVLNATNMPATLQEAVFHDCAVGSGYAGHPPSEAAFLRSVSGRVAIAQGTAQGVCAYFGRSCSTPPPPAKGFIKGVVFKNPDLNAHVAPATVRLNTGQTVTYDGSAVWSFEVPAGTYTISASAAGYTTASVSRTVTAGQTIYGSIGLDEVVVAPTTGFLTGVVYQNPNLQDVISGAVVTVTPGTSTKTYDGVEDWSFELAPGTYTVTAEAPGYEPASITRTVTAGATVPSSIGLDLVPVVAPDAGIPVPVADAGAEPLPEVQTTVRPPTLEPIIGGCAAAPAAELVPALLLLLLVGWGTRRRAGRAGR